MASGKGVIAPRQTLHCIWHSAMMLAVYGVPVGGDCPSISSQPACPPPYPAGDQPASPSVPQCNFFGKRDISSLFSWARPDPSHPLLMSFSPMYFSWKRDISFSQGWTPSPPHSDVLLGHQMLWIWLLSKWERYPITSLCFL